MPQAAVAADLAETSDVLLDLPAERAFDREWRSAGYEDDYQEQEYRREGLAQLDEYLSGLGLDTGWLVIFDQRSGLPEISERTTAETAISPAGRTITVIRG